MAVRIALLLIFCACSARAQNKVSSAEQFQKALAVAKAGDTIVFKNGTWRDVKLNFKSTGVTLRAETPGRVIFQGSSELVIDGTNLVVTGFKFQDTSNVTQTVTPHQVLVRRIIVFTTNAVSCRLTDTAIVNSGEGVTTYVHMRPGSRSNLVDHCWFSGQTGIGVTFYVEAHPTIPNYHRIERNYFGDRKPGRGNGWETMRIGHSAQQEFFSGTSVASNYFFKCNGELECISNKSTGNRYLHNTFVANRGQLCLRHGDKALIQGNYFFGGDEPEAQGVRISGSDHVVIDNCFKGLRDALFIYNGQVDPEPKGYAAVNNALIASNIFENCVNNLILGVGERGRTLPPQNLRIQHNLVQALTPGFSPVIQQLSPIADVKYEGNVVFGAELGIEARPGIEIRKPILPQRTPLTVEDVGPAWMK
jgi:poly(beta-D-mannuronate) lyase